MEIVTAATLPDATVDEVYAQPLIQQPATVSSEVWSLVSGSLPDGITLAANGALNGTPTAEEVSEFTLRVDATCNGDAVSCQKTFTLEVKSNVDCMGNPESIGTANWTELQTPGAGTIDMTGGDGTFSGNASDNGIYVEVTAQICNPNTDPYAITADFAWTVAGGGPPFLGSTQATVRLNGINTNGAAHSLTGNFTEHFDLVLLSGVNTLNLVMNGSLIFPPFTINGTITVRPLTPP